MGELFEVYHLDLKEKVLREEAFAGEKISAFRVGALRGESVRAAFIVSAKRNICRLKFTLSALRAENGEELPAACVRTYMAKYFPVTKASPDTNPRLGEYPDIALPQETAIAYAENKVKRGENKQCFADILPAKEVLAGTYTGELEIEAEGDDGTIEKAALPFDLEVYDYDLPARGYTKQFFILDSDQLRLYEGDGGYETYKTYYEQLSLFRVNGAMPPVQEGETVEKYVAAVRKYYNDESVSVMELPVAYNSDFSDVDYEKTKRYFAAVADACLQDGVNYFQRLALYIWIIDEPHLSGERTVLAKKLLPEFDKFRRGFAEKYVDSSDPFLRGIGETILSVPNVITSGVYAPILPENANDVNVMWCPAFNAPAQYESCAMWKTWNRGEKWWYGCDWPVPPYPTYHIDDTPLSPRLLSWLQYAYGVTGNLYWRANYWAKKTDGKFERCNPYSESSYATNGEGKIIYPGKSYGINGFVPSLRLFEIRDGIRDYDILKEIERLFESNAKKVGLKAAKMIEILAPLFTKMFYKTMIKPEAAEYFGMAKKSLVNYLLAAAHCGFAVTEFCEETREMRFTAEEEARGLNGTEVIKVGEIYKAKTVGEVLKIKCGKYALEFLAQREKQEEKYALSDCWGETVKKFGVKNCEPLPILEPYLNALKLVQENACENETARGKLLAKTCFDLSSLVKFVWKTETAILKEEAGGKSAFTIYLPRGEIKCETENALGEKETLAGGGTKFRVTTAQNEIVLTVKNEKGKFKASLWRK